VAALWPPYHLAGQLEQAGIVVHRLDVSHRWNILQGTARLASLFRRGRYDVVHAHLFYAGIYTALSRPFVSKPRRVVLFHNLAYNTYPATTVWRTVRKQLDGWLMRRGMDGWMAVSPTTAQHYTYHLGVKAITVIPVSVDLSALRPVVNGGAHPNRLTGYGVAPEDFTMILPARFVSEKGHRFLVEALSLLRDQGLYPKALLFGDGPLVPEVAAAVEQRGLRDQVIMRRAVPNAELLPLVRDAQMVVMPSMNEGLPIVALEALALARPLLASRVGGLSSLVEDGVSGLLVPPADPQALADGIARLMTDPMLRERLGRAGRQRVEACYSADAVAGQWETYYKEVLGK
jgi:glycosyltransferase involved in cell wall biosynthesis